MTITTSVRDSGPCGRRPALSRHPLPVLHQICCHSPARVVFEGRRTVPTEVTR